MRRNTKPLKQMSRDEMLKELSKLTRKELKLLLTMFDAYEEDQLAVVESVNEDLQVHRIRTYFNCRSTAR